MTYYFTLVIPVDLYLLILTEYRHRKLSSIVTHNAWEGCLLVLLTAESLNDHVMVIIPPAKTVHFTDENSLGNIQ